MKIKKPKVHITLSGENISLGGSIKYLKCSGCGYETFQLGLQADTDMVYQGIIGLVDITQKRLVITRLNDTEYIEFDSQSVTNRINEMFNTDTFVSIRYDWFTETNTGDEKYLPCCPACNNYMETPITENFEKFIQQGGTIIALEIYNIDTYKQ